MKRPLEKSSKSLISCIYLWTRFQQSHFWPHSWPRGAHPWPPHSRPCKGGSLGRGPAACRPPPGTHPIADARSRGAFATVQRRFAGGPHPCRPPPGTHPIADARSRGSPFAKFLIFENTYARKHRSDRDGETAGLRYANRSKPAKGAWRDNVFVERLWRSVKYEEVYLRAYDSVSDAVHRSADNPHFYVAGVRTRVDGTTPDQADFYPLPLRLAA